MKYLICSSKKWFFDNHKNKYNKKKFSYISNKKELNYKTLKKLNPKIIFFCHWSYIVPKQIFNSYLCINFHTSPLPYGRGGSPIQNLIKRGIKKSPICAIKMTNKIDSGPIYMKKNIQLNGSLSEIFTKITTEIEIMILKLTNSLPKPKDQSGKITVFKRLKPHMSEIKKNDKFSELYNKIRMLDSDEYPKAFIMFNNFKLKFNNIKKVSVDHLSAHCHIQKIK